jgi:hypothetical protein
VGLGRRSGIPHLAISLSAPGGGEGDGEFSKDSLQHVPNMFHHIPVPESDHPITAAHNLDASILIVLSAERVLSAIKLNHQLRRGTGKVHHVSADRMLPAKPMRWPQLAQFSPQPLLSLRHISPEPPGDRRP